MAVWNRILLPQRILFPINKMRCDSTHFVTPVNKLRCDSSTLFVTCSQNCPRQQSALRLNAFCYLFTKLRQQRILLTYLIPFIPYISEHLRNKPNKASLRFLP